MSQSLVSNTNWALFFFVCDTMCVTVSHTSFVKTVKTRGFFSGFEKITRIIEKTKTRETLFVFEMIRVFSRNQLKMHRF